MKVRVKKGKLGFIYNKMRRGDIEEKSPEEFTLKPVEHSTELDDNGKPLIISIESQFSRQWMEKVEEDKPKRGRPAVKKDED